MRKLLVFIVVILALVCTIIVVNYVALQLPMTKELSQDPRNSDITIWSHYQAFIAPSTLVLDLRSVGDDKAPVDVFRCLLQSASAFKSKSFDTVVLKHRGRAKFTLEGTYFKTLGDEYSWQNPVFTIRTFPQHIMKLDGSQAFPTWEGGWIGVTTKQMEDFLEFHKQWYVDDLVG